MIEQKNSPTISVVMAVYNENPKYLKEAVDSILYQTFQNFEFVIIDDGSTLSETQEILSRYAQKDTRIHLLRNEKNMGLTRSLNKGIEKACAKYIARIDSDDISELTRLQKQYEFMEKHPDHALCGSWTHLINEDDEIIGKKKFYTDAEEIKKKILFFNFFTHSTLFFRKDMTMQVGGYSELIKKAQDYDLILKLSAKYPVANLPEFLCFHRLCPNSISSQSKKKQEWYGLIARWNALFQYGHSKKYIFNLIPAFMYFVLIPQSIEKYIIKLSYK